MYKASIVDVHADHDLSPKEKIKFKDTADCIKLDEATKESEGGVLIDPVMWGTLHIQNDKAEGGEYDVHIVVDREGTRYITGSNSFWRGFLDIVEEMQGIDEPWSVRAYRMPSNNFKGKDFITCSVE